MVVHCHDGVLHGGTMSDLQLHARALMNVTLNEVRHRGDQTMVIPFFKNQETNVWAPRQGKSYPGEGVLSRMGCMEELLGYRLYSVS